MEVKIVSRNDVTILRLHGKFIAGRDGPLFRRQVQGLIDSGCRKLLLDFSGVPYIDSTGLGFLAGSRAAALKAGAGLVLVSVGERVKRVLDEVRLSGLFVIEEDDARGIARLEQSA